MEIRIDDPFDLHKTVICGQNFRAKEKDGVYTFITGDKSLGIRKVSDNTFQVDCTQEEWKNIWSSYFDFGLSYRHVEETCCSVIKDQFGQCNSTADFLTRSIDAGRGLRILRQDPWEMILTFIISQRKTMPAIRKAVECLTDRYGKVDGEFRRFPSAEDLRNVTEKEFREAGLGYRAPYALDAVQKVCTKEIDLSCLKSLEDEGLFRELHRIKGVGDKVANCICLFGYHRIGRAPVDVWIERAIHDGCGGINPFSVFGPYAGIMQQYVFYFMTQTPYKSGRKKVEEAAAISLVPGTTSSL